MAAPGPILGLETSCDETAAAVISADGRILSNEIFSQSIHADYGGVVPELASREHAGRLPGIAERAQTTAGIGWDDLAGIAVTAGPGLVGCLLVGVAFARAIARLREIPLIPINHIEAHAHTPAMAANDIEYPYLVLIASGGHSSLVLVERPGQFRSLGETRDDAAGEALDKIGKLLGLSYPAGPEIDRAGEHGNPNAIAFPRARFDDQGFDFSFSGVKTAAALDYRARDFNDNTGISRPDWIASFEAAIVDALLGNLTRAAEAMDIHTVSVAGGVARNRRLRRQLERWAETNNRRAILPAPDLCTDNAAMIAAVGLYRWTPFDDARANIDAVPNWRLGTPLPITP
ncbi:MAG: tRNA (adenosine(37)-N6)-threonylcarbamoyltransferase complex transferase subunit TsaD [candidate division Zixibacteria bacterium]|nr:tRNA (adenosine(37)-N6)-threonylcarbamoyltransferase complex transferase subunit TsaD [candidate division Zixibacteria bacterium]